ncbi:hypothetical protein CO180_04695 [candidate division WWE3 bacterium CG_4_9_14_3_um_filter_41_6]|uniref:Uncharacterized protein n=1 Tax=candidate division WWE3 bacterium CG_4_10_14_0_2_um_filter_41_14 TaxID=1975072 RepID=A0A2M7TI73_UNCKA|nr:MAG: hypothetical protein COY32_04270 [candidate division WWE3 bacterium CG_4_10_14_0_2_um_filter_41_14]PJA37899.1 MAG: hypothetical protein CO180_04695 [candidate division WWE3 bacterium CG_4_9_14_3_um_filter_41_6]
MPPTRFEPGALFTWEEGGQGGYGVVVEAKNRTCVLFEARQNRGQFSLIGPYSFTMHKKLLRIPESATITVKQPPEELANLIDVVRLVLTTLP